MNAVVFICKTVANALHACNMHVYHFDIAFIFSSYEEQPHSTKSNTGAGKSFTVAV